MGQISVNESANDNGEEITTSNSEYAVFQFQVFTNKSRGTCCRREAVGVDVEPIMLLAVTAGYTSLCPLHLCPLHLSPVSPPWDIPSIL